MVPYPWTSTLVCHVGKNLGDLHHLILINFRHGGVLHGPSSRVLHLTLSIICLRFREAFSPPERILVVSHRRGIFRCSDYVVKIAHEDREFGFAYGPS